MNTFKEKVYSLVKKIPKGKVSTYKEIAHALNTRAYRAVGQVLKLNDDGYKDGGKTPCHRIVSSNGHIGGFCGQTKGNEILIKKQLLEKEGIKFDKDNNLINFKKKLFRF